MATVLTPPASGIVSPSTEGSTSPVPCPGAPRRERGPWGRENGRKPWDELETPAVRPLLRRCVPRSVVLAQRSVRRGTVPHPAAAHHPPPRPAPPRVLAGPARRPSELAAPSFEENDTKDGASGKAAPPPARARAQSHRGDEDRSRAPGFLGRRGTWPLAGPRATVVFGPVPPSASWAEQHRWAHRRATIATSGVVRLCSPPRSASAVMPLPSAARPAVPAAMVPTADFLASSFSQPFSPAQHGETW